jgi:hypothetical protein
MEEKMLSENYTIESNTPFRIRIKNRTGLLWKSVLILLLVAWGYIQIKFTLLFVWFFIGLLTPGNREGVVITYSPAYMGPIMVFLFWVFTMAIFIIGLVGGGWLGILILQEIMWRFVGVETLEISKDSIVWSRQIPLVHLVKSYPVSALRKMDVAQPPAGVDLEKLDKIRTALVTFRGMGNGAISLEYEKDSSSIVGLLKSTDAEKVLNRLKDLNYFDLPIRLG